MKSKTQFKAKLPETDTTVQRKYTLMRAEEVNARRAAREQRLYYCDSDVDLVATTMARKHVEPPHLHTENTETYYVIRGILILRVEREQLILKEGDLVVIPSNVCHSFETGDAEVSFLAIKRYPLLKDKKLC